MPLGPSLDPFPIKQVANGRGGARQLQTDSVPSPVWLSLEDITKEDHSSTARSVNTACGYVSSSANASRPQAEPLTLRGIKTWPDSRPPPGPGGGTLDRKAIGCWASVTRGGGCRSQPRACRDCAPPPTCRLDPSCTACAPAGRASPSSPQFPVAGGQLGPGFGASVAQRSAADLGII